MRLVFLLCTAFALGVAAGETRNVPEEMVDAPQNMQPEVKPDESLTGPVEQVETVLGTQEGRLSRNGCLPGWSKYGSRCFIFINRRFSWIEAERICLEKDANLASIHDLREYDFIQEIVRGATGSFPQTWIGGTDAVRDSTWFWSDGSRLQFMHWGRGQPSDYNCNEKCVEMNDYVDLRWNDQDCKLQLPFVCGTRPTS